MLEKTIDINLVRDQHSNALLNTDRERLKERVMQKQRREESESIKHEIQEIRKEIREIWQFLQDSKEAS
jgi:hypothetical protein